MVKPLKLLLANKAYSSWSLRGWLLLKQTGLEFSEQVEDLRSPAFYAMLRDVSPTMKVPTLLHGELSIWESLAIAEYCADLAPGARIWPDAAEARAIARTLCAEMHAGFSALRSRCPMQMRRKVPGFVHDDATCKDIARINEIWTSIPETYGTDGPFLFGAWCAADAFFAPVASRFWTYGADLSPAAERYMNAVLSHPWMREWTQAANREKWVNSDYEL